MRISDWSSDVCSSDLSPKAFERILWVRGMQLAIGCDRALVATTETDPRIARFARDQKVALISRAFLSRIEIGRASCRERVCQYVSISVVAVSFKKKTTTY